jgi:aspartate racemase
MRLQLLGRALAFFALPLGLLAATPPPPAAQMKTLGLIGGTSWYSSAEYYRYLNKAVNDLYGNNTNPPLLLLNLNQQHIHELQAKGQWDEIANILVASSQRLEAAGAQGILFCANTPHKVYAQVAARTRLPILHIADATGAAIRARGLRTIGLIGTLYTMEDGFFAQRLKERFGVATLVPESADARRELHRIVQQELGLGVFTPDSKRFILAQLEELRRRGAEGVVLGCTEFPLVIHADDLPVPVFDTVLLHSDMALDFILGRDASKR